MDNKTGKKNIAHTIKNLVAETIKNLGLELWDVEYYNDNGEWLLEITIDIIDIPDIIDITKKTDGKTGISLDDCETVTKAVAPIIDAADPIENSYSLVVSSPGLGRELKNDAHINKYINKPVFVNLFAKNENLSPLNIDGKNFTGVLKEYSGDMLTFEVFEQRQETAKANKKQKNKKNNIMDIKETEANNINKIITLAKKDIAHIYAHDEL